MFPRLESADWNCPTLVGRVYIALVGTALQPGAEVQLPLRPLRRPWWSWLVGCLSPLGRAPSTGISTPISPTTQDGYPGSRVYQEMDYAAHNSSRQVEPLPDLLCSFVCRALHGPRIYCDSGDCLLPEQAAVVVRHSRASGPTAGTCDTHVGLPMPGGFSSRSPLFSLLTILLYLAQK